MFIHFTLGLEATQNATQSAFVCKKFSTGTLPILAIGYSFASMTDYSHGYRTNQLCLIKICRSENSSSAHEKRIYPSPFSKNSSVH
jgi:hypothetical protein